MWRWFVLLSPALAGCDLSGSCDGERIYGGGQLTLTVDDPATTTDRGGTTSVDGMSEPGGTGARMSEPLDASGLYVVEASIPDPGWTMFPDATDAVIEVELLLGREPLRAEVIRAEWIDPAGPRMNVAVTGMPSLDWDAVHQGTLVLADMPWEDCSSGACDDVLTATTTIAWSFDATPLVETGGCD